MQKTPTTFNNPENRSEILSELHPDSAWVFVGEGVTTRKYDGGCLVKGGMLYKRQKIKKRQEPRKTLFWLILMGLLEK